jgi:hypothetical protein
MNRQCAMRKWFSAWLKRDGACIDEVFSEDVRYTECYGPEYLGREQVKQWFKDWNADNRVTRWDICGFVEQGDMLAAEWHFECECAGERDGFDGVTLARFDGSGRICRLKEFKSCSERVYPYGMHGLIEK